MLLLVEKQDGIAVVTLNRPEAMNALSKAMRSALYKAMTELDADPEVSVVILTGASERAFTAGLDLPTASGLIRKGLPLGGAKILQVVQLRSDILLLAETLLQG